MDIDRYFKIKKKTVEKQKLRKKERDKNLYVETPRMIPRGYVLYN